VHLIHASDGNLPSDMALTTKDGLEEELRLFYVALTRPRRALYVYVPLRYYHRRLARDDAHGYAKPSRFLTIDVERHFEIVRADHELGEPSPRRSPVSKVQISLEHLWR
jgi:DNA helicase II / ATP-dependent DNA helicase PcrA